MKFNKILLLGGAYHQIPMIKEAQNQGYYVVTCDHSPENPGHKISDEYFNVSTTDYKGVLTLAKRIKPKLVIAYASDPAAPVAAYVSEKLGLPGSPYESIKLLSEKDLFRIFLGENGFKTPQTVTLKAGDNFSEKTKELTYPFIVKPTDSSGSKGVMKVFEEADLNISVDYALNYSRNKRIIAEEFIECDGNQLHGEGFVVDGELIFSYLGDHHYNEAINPFVPYSTTWPSKKEHKLISKIELQISKAIKLSGYKNGPVNIEIRVDRNGEIYIMEIGPRNGGNFVPQVIRELSGFDMVKALLDLYTGKQIKIPGNLRRYGAYYVLHSPKNGELIDVVISKEIKPYIKEFYQYKKSGDKVDAFHGANAAIGLAILSFENSEQMNYYINKSLNFISVKVKV